ncbi:PQQ-binding-like beta-propeller repeat protein [Sphingomonas sp. BN140010]|uniref:PQQ-binding-like beta-propeller repeat protein n=1 Tax=Sphingomonas arvum TaxID=2992113 RepID=A0ABT3JH30_9SPHN|nr:PQQ-binding-like beta-propeller repeat protein [Sphingomonas sp. BN140010]MCW3798301.1 PQQ-binding-like beta-propeller repeat protein [Sphingomonas sp. BN140010]
MNKRIAGVMIAAALLSACNPFNRSRPKTPVVGNRVSVLTQDLDIAVDPETAALPFSLPAVAANPDWAQPGGNPAKSLGHLALGATLGNAWTASIGAGDRPQARLASAPVVADGKVFTIDTTSTVRAFEAASGRQLWATQFGTEKGNGASLFGGGVAVANGRVFATNGLGFVAALDTGNGGIGWQVRLGGPLRGAPSVDGTTVYVMSQDNQIFSLKAADGATNWSNPAALEIAGVFGTGAPAIAQSTVVAGFSSGELNAYRAENGRTVWQDALARTSISTSVATLSDIDASPVIDNGQVFAVGQGGRMVAIDLLSGQRIWELNLAGISTPWVAGDWVFVTTDDAKLVAIARNTGKIRWINQLPAWRNAKSRKGAITYVGPILAGERLIVAGSNGALINVDPATGAFQSQTNVGAGVHLSPVVANSTLYILDDNARLHAFR